MPGSEAARPPGANGNNAMSPLVVALIYFGSFLAVGLAAKIAIGMWMKKSGVDLPDLQAQAGPNRRKHKAFLLGAWRNED
jgi:hypothetical protein